MNPMMRAASPSPDTYPRPGQPARWVALAVVLVVAGAGLWWIATLPARELKNAEALLAEVSQRTFDYRLPGAPYAQVHPEEHKQPAFAKPVPLLEAESLVARRLARDPDRPQWLRLRAHLEMLDSDPETAIATLQHALEQQPDNPELLADLGVAYALRADTQNRDVDFAYAIEYLSRSLKAKPNSAVAVFNHLRADIFAWPGRGRVAPVSWAGDIRHVAGRGPAAPCEPGGKAGCTADGSGPDFG